MLARDTMRHAAAETPTAVTPLRSSPADTLFRIKLAPPRTAFKPVERRRLLDHAGQVSAKLVIVRAPAGFGKTTLLQQWRDRLLLAKVACGWLTLDSADDDPTKLITGLGAAIHSAVANHGRGQAAIAVNDTGSMAGSVDRLESLGRPFVLFLDDVDAIQSPAARSVLQTLLRSTPLNVQVVIAGRSIPSLGQARLRLSDAVADIGEDDLRFRRDEISAFFSSRLSNPLTTGQLDELHRYTDGWAAALQLTSLTLRHSGPVRSLSDAVGLQSGVTEYLHEDVLDRQPPEVRRFLLDVSILRLLNGQLCNAVTGGSDGDAMLSMLDEEGLFLKRVEVHDGVVWYRFHALFADFLRRDLHSEGGNRVARLHLSASDWFAANGMPVEAAEHAQAGGHTERSLMLLDDVAMEHVQRGQLTTVLRWGAGLTAETARRYERLFAAYLWAEGFVGDSGKALRRFEDLVALSSSWDSLSPLMINTIACMPVMLAGARQDFETMWREGPIALKKLQVGTFEHGTVANCVAYGYLCAGQVDLARDAIQLAKIACQDAGRFYNMAHTQMIDGVIHICDLRLDRALVALRHGYDRISSEFSALSQSSGTVAAYYSEALYEGSDLETATGLIERHLGAIAEAIPECTVTGYRTAARLAIARGDTDRAREFLFEMRSHGLRRQSEILVHAAGWENCWLDALHGDRTNAARLSAELSQIERDVTPVLLSPAEALVRDVYRLRVAVYLGIEGWTIDEIDALIENAQERGLGLRRLRLEIIKAVALKACAFVKEAREQMRHALELGLTNDFVQCFLDEGPVAQELARAVLPVMMGSAPSPAQQLLSQRLFRKEESRSSYPASNNAASGSVLEALTERESDILLILEKGLTNREIADCMNVSESTIKWHLRNIFDKLGVGNRTEAASLLRIGL